MKIHLLYIWCFLMATVSLAAQTYTPVTVAGFNWDGVAENQPASATTTAGGLDLTFHVMYDVYYGTLYSSGLGLPNSGTIVNGSRTYQLQPYTSNNILFLMPGATDSLTLPTPAAYSSLSLLGFATETQSTNTITLEFTDGSVLTTSGNALQDWFGGVGYMISGFDRADQNTGTPLFLATNDPRMYPIDFTLSCADQAKLLKTIVFTNNSTLNQRTCIMALSGVAGPTFSFTNSNPTCASGHDGTAMVNVSGGNGPFSYTWSTSPVQTTNPATALTAGAYTVSVRDAGGCTFAEPDTLQNGAPLTLMLTATPDSVCAGASAILIGTGAVSYTWSAGVPTDSADVVTPLSTTSYSVTATTAAGCIEYGNVSVAVKPIPPAPLISASGPLTFCQGGNVVLTSSATSGNIWSDNETTTAVTVSATGSYTVSDTVDGCASPASAPVAVTVNPTPTAPVITGGPTTFCQGDSVVLTSSAATGNTWSTGATTQSITVSVAGPYTVTQTIAGCTSPSSAPVTVTVNPIPTAPVITAGGPVTFCQGGNVVLTSSAPTGDLWSDNETTASITVTTSGTYTVTQTVSGCTSPPSASVTVTVNPLPAAPVISASGPLTFCQGDSVVLTSSAAAGNLWSIGDTTQSITVSASGSFTVTQTLSGCTSAPSAPVTVTVNPIPAAPVITAGGPTAICIGTSVTLTSSTPTGDFWSDNETTASITVSSAGTYTVTQTAAGCTSPPSAPVAVSIIPLPQPVIVASQPTICPGSPVSLDATTAGASSYIWNTGAAQAAVTIDSPGIYYVSVTVNGCTGADTISISSKPLLGTLTLPDSSLICQGDSVAIDATTPNATAYQWSESGDTTAVVYLHNQGVYTVTVSNSCGSLAAMTTLTVRDCNCNIYMPDAFTPNGDGINDRLGLYFDCPGAQYMLMRIFDRWGEKVFETNDLSGQWDGTYLGTPVLAGMYVYYVDFTGMEGNTPHTFHLSGSVTLIR